MKQEGHTSQVLKKIESAKLEFHRWRSDLFRKGRIPERLWGIAIDLTSDIGPTQTRKLLSLDYVALKKKMLELNIIQPPVQFVKMDLEMTRSLDCQLEIQSASHKMIINMKGIEVDTLIQLIQRLESK